jgi:hypothetical protein
MRGLFTLAIWFAAANGTVFAQCEIATPVRKLLEKPEFRGKIVESAAERDARHASYLKAQDAYPDNYFVCAPNCVILTVIATPFSGRATCGANIRIASSTK